MDPHMAEARRILTAGLREARKLTPRAQAEAAHHAGGPSVDTSSNSATFATE
jgi:hypothetical protein